MGNTQGNWHVDGFNVTSVISKREDGGYDHVCFCNNRGIDSRDNFELNKSNAKLIAAAPDLLAACKMALDILKEIPDNIPTEVMTCEIVLEHAIKKATE